MSAAEQAQFDELWSALPAIAAGTRAPTDEQRKAIDLMVRYGGGSDACRVYVAAQRGYERAAAARSGSPT